MENPKLKLRQITKKFGTKIANDNIDLEVKRGTVHCIIGENGSGKTTLMNMIFGLYKPDSGQIYLDGNEVKIDNPKRAHQYKIGMVHQHFMLFERHTVLENIILGEERSKIFLNMNSSERIIEEMINRYHFQINLRDKIQDLSVGTKQKIEILKILYRGADLIIFDEPTAVLTPEEADQLMEIILNLKKSGKTILFISHKLNEVAKIGDYVTVLRGGQIVYETRCEKDKMQKIAYEMVGKETELNNLPRKPFSPGKVVLELSGGELKKGRAPFSFKVHEGEIVGIAGVDGNGQLELEQMVMGILKQKNCKIKLTGEEISQSTVLERKMKGIVYVPSDRLKYAVMEDETLSDNFLLGNQERENFNAHGIIKHKELLEFGKKIINEYDIRTGGVDATIRTLSGGNQQKVVLGRELSQEHKLVLVAQPTRGLDIGAIEFVHKRILEERDSGKAVILISTELSEIMELSDRIIVLYEGEIMSDAPISEYSREIIGLRMAGRKESIHER